MSEIELRLRRCNQRSTSGSAHGSCARQWQSCSFDSGVDLHRQNAEGNKGNSDENATTLQQDRYTTYPLCSTMIVQTRHSARRVGTPRRAMLLVPFKSILLAPLYQKQAGPIWWIPPYPRRSTRRHGVTMVVAVGSFIKRKILKGPPGRRQRRRRWPCGTRRCDVTQFLHQAIC